MGAVDYTIPGKWTPSPNLLSGVEMGDDGVVRNAEGEEITYYEGKKVAWEHDGFRFSEEQVNRALEFWYCRSVVGGPVTPSWFRKLRELLKKGLPSLPGISNSLRCMIKGSN